MRSISALTSHRILSLTSSTNTLFQPSIPPPLQIPPSRARRQFALRLAQRKAQLESTREAEEDPDDPSAPKTQEQEEREGHQRFARMFEGIEDSSDDDSLHSIEGIGEDEESILGRIEVEGQEVGRRSPLKVASPEKVSSPELERRESGGEGKEDEKKVVV